MTESELYAGIATTLLDKFAGRIIKGLTDPVKKAWEQFKIDFDIVSSLDDKEVYSLFKSTWIGEQLNTMARLRETLEHRRRRETQDLFGFLDG